MLPVDILSHLLLLFSTMRYVLNGEYKYGFLCICFQKGTNIIGERSLHTTYKYNTFFECLFSFL